MKAEITMPADAPERPKPEFLDLCEAVTLALAPDFQIEFDRCALYGKLFEGWINVPAFVRKDRPERSAELRAQFEAAAQALEKAKGRAWLRVAHVRRVGRLVTFVCQEA